MEISRNSTHELFEMLLVSQQLQTRRRSGTAHLTPDSFAVDKICRPTYVLHSSPKETTTTTTTTTAAAGTTGTATVTATAFPATTTTTTTTTTITTTITTTAANYVLNEKSDLCEQGPALCSKWRNPMYYTF